MVQIKTCVLLLLCVQVVRCLRKNILFLVSDDMRPEIGAYLGPDFPSPIHPTIHTPNLDALASKSLLLKRAYVQQAICSPSRTSLLTGRRPDTTHVYDLVHYFRHVGGNYTTIPQFFKNNGYRSIGMGKIFHHGKASGYDDPISWSEPYYHAPDEKYRSNVVTWRAVSKAEYDIRPLPDMQLTDYAIKSLRRVALDAKSGKQNFFIALGFHKPHLPFVFPEKYLDLYPKDKVRLPDNPYAPVNMPEIAWINYMTEEMANYHDVKEINPSGDINTTLPDHFVLNLRRAYYSAVSYIDDLVGKVLHELDTLGLSDNTVVSFWGDHGWQLGEHGEWSKHTNFEDATHAPMMVHVPGITDKGIITERLVDFVDLFPTLVEVAGFQPLSLCPVDSTKVDLCREGTSFVPLMKDPKCEWKSGAFSQYPRMNYTVMGYTVRTDMYRYTEWPEFIGEPEYKPNWKKLYGVELYDHSNDPEENYNRANDPSYSSLKQQLSAKLRRGWRYSQPKETISLSIEGSCSLYP
ncbi:hypothetical protein SNE40_014742 [Patella caerulea]|uniref:Sulfatase N-terminal domain-containing protein n=1 Tax=Patella caerulea TaxID=87958 RepID=A0AAN8PDG1_PATCE